MTSGTAFVRYLAFLLLPVLAACTPRAAERPAEFGQAATQPVQIQLDAAELQRVQGISVGTEGAPVVIYEFADFACPGCAQFAAVVTPHVKQRYVEQGHVRFVHYDFPLLSIHPTAFLAARAGRCAHEQDRFWEYHDVLYAQQRGWAAEQDPAATFVEYAGQVGIDRQRFEACLRSDRYAEEVTRNLRLGEALGVPGTPTLFINGRRIEIRSLEDLDRQIQEEIRAAGGSG
ncbi:MAG: DsbA family protein [Gemmatimonadetes bacterium]|nr:DsbA family protein [Gemmatimonadota bacterium]